MQKKNGVVVFVVVIVVVLAIALHVTFNQRECGTYSCFKNAMEKCRSGIKFVNEEPEASWLYTLQGRKQDNCEVKVTLLQAKEGDLALRKFEGHSMVCDYPAGVSLYPEKDMSKCHGELKEDVQSVIIDKLYQYIIRNIGDIKEDLLEIGI